MHLPAIIKLQIQIIYDDEHPAPPGTVAFREALLS